jgi:hypothetical protein
MEENCLAQGGLQFFDVLMCEMPMLRAPVRGRFLLAARSRWDVLMIGEVEKKSQCIHEDSLQDSKKNTTYTVRHAQSCSTNLIGCS